MGDLAHGQASYGDLLSEHAKRIARTKLEIRESGDLHCDDFDLVRTGGNYADEFVDISPDDRDMQEIIRRYNGHRDLVRILQEFVWLTRDRQVSLDRPKLVELRKKADAALEQEVWE